MSISELCHVPDETTVSGQGAIAHTRAQHHHAIPRLSRRRRYDQDVAMEHTKRQTHAHLLV